MLRQIIAATAIALLTVSAHAGDSIEMMGPTAKPDSVSYVGYDSFDAEGNPICTPCQAKRAEEAARLKAYAERRERSRLYMARLQGKEVPASSDSLIAANAAPLIPAGQPLQEKVIGDVAETPLRAGLQ
jgi:hypothetical protein